MILMKIIFRSLKSLAAIYLKSNVLPAIMDYNEPKTLAQELNGVIKKKGIEDAISTYHELYKQYYGGFSYNFKDNSLAELTHMLIDEKNYDAAIKISNLNIETYPNSGLAYFTLGESYEASGDKDKSSRKCSKVS